MKEYWFTVKKTGWIHVEADSIENAEAKLKDFIHHFYVRTENGEEPADDSWEPTGEVELEEEEEEDEN